MRDRVREEDYFNARVMIEASRWLEQNKDAEKFFLTVESFDPHEPWFVPAHYRRMYDPGDGPEQVISGYADTSSLGAGLLARTRATYSGLVTMCDRWFGHLVETIQALGLSENTLVIFTTDHGHSIGDYGYMGKRGYPSSPEVYEVPLMIRHPRGLGAGKRSGMFAQHTDIAAQILEFAGVAPQQLDGRPFWKQAVEGGRPIRDHVTVGWGSTITVIDEDWWLNCKVDGKGVFLRRLSPRERFGENQAGSHPEIVRELFHKAVEDAGGSFPPYILAMAENQKDAPGCSDLAARE
jgi:arylsulfatase A-like enzyme